LTKLRFYVILEFMDSEGSGQSATGGETLADRVARLEERLARLEAAAVREPAAAAAAAGSAPNPFWALEELKEHVAEPGAVLFTGTVTLPTGEHYEWQIGRTTESLLADDWAPDADALAALAQPMRLLLVHQVLLGVRTTAELGDLEQLGTTGQLYHHLRQLVAAGWLRSTARGQYAVPAERVVPLLTILAAARR
jgi:hypothetical protein